MIKLKYLLEEIKGDVIKTHLVVNGVDNGISGFFKRSELLEKYGENDAEIEAYEKDFGDGVIGIIKYLAIEVQRGE